MRLRLAGLIAVMIFFTLQKDGVWARSSVSIPAPRPEETALENKSWQLAYIFGLGQIQSLQYSPTGDRLAVASSIGIEIWDTSSWELVSQLFGHRDVVYGVSWSPDGSTLVSCSRDTTLKLWEVETGLLLSTLTGHRGFVVAVGWSPDGNKLASGSLAGVKIWDAGTGALLRDLDTEFIYCLDWSRDSRRVAAGTYSGAIVVWDADTGTQQMVLTGHLGPVNSLSWSPDGQRLVSAGDDTSLRVWNLPTGASDVLRGHESRVVSVSWSPDGRQLASGSDDTSIQIWDANRLGMPVRTLTGHRRTVVALTWSPTSDTLISGSSDLTIKVWDVRGGALSGTLLGHTPPVNSVALSPDDSQIAVAAGTKITLWNFRTGEVREFTEQSGPVYAISWSRDGRKIATGGSVDRAVKIWDARTGDLLNTLLGHTNIITTVHWSMDSSKLVSGAYDNTVRVWDAARGRLLTTLIPHDHERNTADDVEIAHGEAVLSVSWSPDGRTVAAGYQDNRLRLWHPEIEHLLSTLVEGNWVSSVAWSWNGSLLAAGCYDGTLSLWDARTLADPIILNHPGARLHAIAWSPDADRIAASVDNFTIDLWDIETGELSSTIIGHTGWIPSLAWSAKGDYVVSGSLDGTVRLWSLN
jgi:WD40 repeat protein